MLKPNADVHRHEFVSLFLILNSMNPGEPPPWVPPNVRRQASRPSVPSNNQGNCQEQSGLVSQLSNLLEHQKSQILSSVSNLVNEKLGTFKDQISTEIVEHNHQITRVVQHKLDQAETYTFKKKGCEEQYKFNKSILNTTNNAIAALSSKELDKAQEFLKEGIIDIKNRQKLIKIADKSEQGWLTVKEYVGDREIASDEEDSQRIRKAEKQALRKRLSTKNNRSNPYPVPNLNVANRVPNEGAQNYLPYYPNYFRRRFGQARNFRKFNPSDICFKCGKTGHWFNFCQQKTGGNDTTDSNDPKPK